MSNDKYRAAVAAVAAEKAINPSDVTGYQVAQHLRIADGGAFYKEWQAFRDEEFGGRVAPPTDIPPELMDRLKEVAERGATGMITAAVDVIRAGRAGFEAAASLQVRDAERRADHAKVEAGNIHASLEAREAERDAVMAELEAARQSNEQKDRQIVRLEGMLEQCNIDRRAALQMRVERSQAEQAETTPSPSAVPPPEHLRNLGAPSSDTMSAAIAQALANAAKKQL